MASLKIFSLILLTCVCTFAENSSGILKISESQELLDGFSETPMSEVLQMDPLEASPVKLDPNNSCYRDFRYTFGSLPRMWALQMVDSAGKPTSGLLRGGNNWIGDYDSCLKVVAPASVNRSEDSSSDGFRGRYCRGELPLGDFSGRLAICVPSSCTEELLAGVSLSEFVPTKGLNPMIAFILRMIPALNNLTCLPRPEETEFSSASIACIIVLVIACFAVVTATAYDLWCECAKKGPAPTSIQNEDNIKEHNELSVETNGISEVTKSTVALAKEPKRRGKLLETWLAFSVLKNARPILDTTVKEGQINCIHGIRFLSLSWVILGHAISGSSLYMTNMVELLELTQNSFWFQAIMQGTFSVDTFFLLSGFLMSYLMIKDKRVMKWTSWVYFYVHRFVRLTPVYMMVIFVSTTLWYNLGDGPLWVYPKNRDVPNACVKYWWYNLLYINNFLPAQNQCLPWGWYLANDMQFYVISPLFLIPLKNSKFVVRLIGLVFVFALFLSSLIASGVITTVNNMGIFMRWDAESGNASTIEQQAFDSFDAIYDKPWTRIGPYLIGVFLAYAMLETKRLNWKPKKLVVIIAWIVAVILNVTVVYGLYKQTPNIHIKALHNSVTRSVWALTVAWLLFACLTNNAGPVNKLLSWSFWFPLSRLTYCAYLVHPQISMWYYMTLRTPFHFTLTTLAVYYLGFLMLSYGLALLVSLVFEGPVMRIEKILRG